MKKQDALDFLESHKQLFIERFGVKHLALFGSTARDEASDDSDLDVLVEFEGGETYRNYFDLLFYLEDHLHCEIDLVCHDAVRPQLKPYIEKEALYVT
ncbi:MAG TPA: nucleotidyltransferase family protein [Gallionella sp.]|nr:nucleotidyltransferase family protein [Gallionella sp.]